MNVFIDLGVFDGDTIKQFIQWSPLTGKEDWDIYGFEPNPRYLKDIKWINENTNAIVSNSAVWYEDTKIEFTVRPEDAPYGSTAIKEKGDWGMGQIILVEAIDFSKWLKDRFTKDDYIIVKSDIEGSEYKVLEKCIDDGTDQLIDLLLVEWHDEKISGDLPKLRSKIESAFGDRLFEWL